MSAPAPKSSSGVRVLTEPAVPTGMNAGVCTVLPLTAIRPARAAVFRSFASSVNLKAIEGRGSRTTTFETRTLGELSLECKQSVIIGDGGGYATKSTGTKAFP